MDKMENYIFTFGIGQTFERSAVRVTASDFNSARKIMVKKYGLQWAIQYLEEDYRKALDTSGLNPYPVIDELVEEEKLASFEFQWEAKVQKSVEIEAENEGEAYQKWLNGEFGKVDINDEEMASNYVELNGVVYYGNRFEKVEF